MWEPVGPLPASVYWRRRLVAMGSILAVLVVSAWVATGLADPADAGPTERPTARAALAAPEQAGPSAPTPPAEAPAGAPGPVAVVPAVAPADTGVATTTGATAATSEELRPDDTPRPPVEVPPAEPIPASGPVPCTNEMISVGAEIDRTEHRVGERPELRLVVTNISGQPCVRDLDSSRQEIVVWRGDGTRLWSSNDCVNASTDDLRTLVPGQPIAFAVTWAGRTSTPGCAERRTVVPAGSYYVLTRVDDVISGPAPFVRSE